MFSIYSHLADSPATGPYYAPVTTGFEAPATQGWGGGGVGFAGFVSDIIGVINTLIPLLITIAVIIFFVGLGQYVYNSDSHTGRHKGIEMIKWGLVALFVLVSLWGILDVAKTSVFTS
jgi:hypothetical protein